MKNKELNFGLVEGRHPLPVEEYIFTGELNPVNVDDIEKTAEQFAESKKDFKAQVVNIYATGLTVALISAIKGFKKVFPEAQIVIKHYNRDTGEYFNQYI